MSDSVRPKVNVSESPLASSARITPSSASSSRILSPRIGDPSPPDLSNVDGMIHDNFKAFSKRQSQIKGRVSHTQVLQLAIRTQEEKYEHQLVITQNRETQLKASQEHVVQLQALLQSTQTELDSVRATQEDRHDQVIAECKAEIFREREKMAAQLRHAESELQARELKNLQAYERKAEQHELQMEELRAMIAQEKAQIAEDMQHTRDALSASYLKVKELEDLNASREKELNELDLRLLKMTKSFNSQSVRMTSMKRELDRYRIILKYHVVHKYVKICKRRKELNDLNTAITRSIEALLRDESEQEMPTTLKTDIAEFQGENELLLRVMDEAEKRRKGLLPKDHYAKTKGKFAVARQKWLDLNGRVNLDLFFSHILTAVDFLYSLSTHVLTSANRGQRQIKSLFDRNGHLTQYIMSQDEKMRKVKNKLKAEKTENRELRETIYSRESDHYHRLRQSAKKSHKKKTKKYIAQNTAVEVKGHPLLDWTTSDVEDVSEHDEQKQHIGQPVLTYDDVQEGVPGKNEANVPDDSIYVDASVISSLPTEYTENDDNISDGHDDTVASERFDKNDEAHAPNVAVARPQSRGARKSWVPEVLPGDLWWEDRPAVETARLMVTKMSDNEKKKQTSVKKQKATPPQPKIVKKPRPTSARTSRDARTTARLSRASDTNEHRSEFSANVAPSPVVVHFTTRGGIPPVPPSRLRATAFASESYMKYQNKIQVRKEKKLSKANHESRTSAEDVSPYAQDMQLVVEDTRPKRGSTRKKVKKIKRRPQSAVRDSRARMRRAGLK